MYLQEILRPHTGGEGGVGPGEQTTPRTPHTTPVLSNEQSKTRSVTPSRVAEGATDANQRTIDRAKEGV